MKTKEKYTKTGILLMGILILLGLFGSSVSAFAVSSAYWEENPITIFPGETKDIKIVLQNMAGTEDIFAKGVITQGSEIAEIIDAEDIYSVPLGQRTTVNIRISLPEDAGVEDEYTLGVSFTTTTSEDAGPLGFGSGIERIFPIIVIAEPKPEGNLNMTYLLIGIILLLLIIFVVVKRRKKTAK